MINPRIFAFLALIGILIGIFYGGQFLFQKPKVIAPIIVQPTPIIIEKYITVMVTPTPDGRLYFASEYQNGTRLLKRPYSFIRYNALYKQDMKVTTIVYDYKFFEKLHWFNPTTYKYQEQLPDTGYKWCFIFVYTFMDDIIGDDTRMWAFNRSFFSVYNEKSQEMFTALEYPYQLRYKELEQTPTFDNSQYVQAFKQVRMYSSSSSYSRTAGEYSDEQYYLRGGISNAIDGYLLYQIPINTTENDILVFGNFYSFGFSQWRTAF